MVKDSGWSGRTQLTGDKMKPTCKNHVISVLTTALLSLLQPVATSAAEAQAPLRKEPPCGYFKIQVVDRQTERGVPLVQLRTVNNIRYYTDSNGIVAFCEPGLMDREVFFFVESHGYEFPKDGFGFRGTRLKIEPGSSAVIKIDRINIAERLYRVTGQGIYHDSILTGHPVPLKNPALSGQVTGQDSVFTCVYHGRLFWMWGDTSRPSYPLGNFSMSAAVSELPENGGLDPAIGVDLEYYVGEDGFSRPMSPLKEPGLVWLDGLITLADNDARQRMVAKYARLKGLGEVLERGLVVFNDASDSFEPLVRDGVDCLPYRDSGHAFRVSVDGRTYYYFAIPFPMAVRMRVRARWNDVIDPNCYEVLTALEPKTSDGPQAPRLDLGGSEKPCRWVRFADLTGSDSAASTSVIEALTREKAGARLYDVASGRKIIPHGGSVYYNAHRRRWIMITVQHGGDSSYLGEVWYAEADTPVGPWAYAAKIATHTKYSFYNPKQHPLFDRDAGRVIFFEGTYSHTFSGSAENATPRYDYNQIMYRLNLDDPRLVLPVPVYRIRTDAGEYGYLLHDEVEKAGNWNLVQSIPFYAVEPHRAHDKLVGIYARTSPADTPRTFSLTLDRSLSSGGPLFYALPASPGPVENSSVKPLYEYRNADTGLLIYSTEPPSGAQRWVRNKDPLCCVWKAPPGALLADSKAKPDVGN
jgi:hypothetical protein